MEAPKRIYADCLCLVYHEARNVRHLVKEGYLAETGLEKIISQPTNRDEAWRKIQPLREVALGAQTVEAMNGLFEKQFGLNLDQLLAIYRNPNWKHAKSYGGNAWAQVTDVVVSLGKALSSQDEKAIAEACERIAKARHNNGTLLEKLAGLDARLSQIDFRLR